ncbi:MAG: response regulator [Candidatus Riflebacteria bacterium]|nr:response regulator [Candidatus Riflebacteria bacterium]
MNSVHEKKSVAQLGGGEVFRSLKLRFVAYSLSAMLLVSGIVILIIMSFANTSLDAQYQQQLSRLVGECTEELRMVVLSNQSDKIENSLRKIAGFIDATAIRLVNPAGSTVASYSDGAREQRLPTIAYQHKLLVPDKDGKAQEWWIRLRVRPNALSALADNFMLYQVLIVLMMSAGAIVGISFALEITVGRRIQRINQYLQTTAKAGAINQPDDTLNDEFTEIGVQIANIIKTREDQHDQLKRYVDAAKIVCFTIVPADETVQLIGDVRKLLHVEPESISHVDHLIKLLLPDQIAEAKERWLKFRKAILTGTGGQGYRESTWQLGVDQIPNINAPDSKVWIKSVFYWNANAPVPIAYGVISDVTDKKHSETALQSELEYFRSIYKNLPVGIWRSHSDQFVSMNQAMAEIIGYSSPEEAIKAVQSIGHQLYITPVDRTFFFDELKKRDQVRSLEMKFRRANGQLFWAAVFGRIFFEDGRQYCEGCFVDITEKKLAEEKLRANEEILRQSIEGSRVVVWELEPVSGQLILFGAVKRLLGDNAVTVADLKDFYKLVHSEDLQLFKAYFEKAKQSDAQKEVHYADFRICRLSSENKTKIHYLRILSDAGDNLYATAQKTVRGLLIDITNLISANAATRKGDKQLKFEDMDTAELFTNMNHEIRTPLNAIIGYSELLIPLAENGRTQQYTASIVAASRSLINIVNSIQDLVRLESGQVKPVEGPLCIADLIAEVDSMFTAEAERKGLEFWVQIDSEVPAVIVFDEARLREILINLVSNAVKFTNQGSVGMRVSLGHSPQQGMINLLISVEDTGIGIACENPEEIFDPLRRHKEHNKFGGTGLGLAICRRLIELLNGTIKVKTELQRGTRFDVIFRDVRVAERSKRQIQPDSVRKSFKFNGQKIIVADDTASNRELVAEAMKSAGLTVVCASDGNEAVEMAKKEHPELIFMDLRMPQKDGVCAARELRCCAELASVPIIAVTATNSFAELEELKGLFDGFIIKPVSLLRLFSEAARFLSYAPGSETAKEKADFRLPPEAFEQLSNPWALCEIVSKEFMNKFAPTDNAIVIDELTDLAEKVKKVSLLHSFNILSLEAESLIGSLQQYDITAIKNSRNKISKIFTQLLEVYARS